MRQQSPGAVEGQVRSDLLWRAAWLICWQGYSLWLAPEPDPLGLRVAGVAHAKAFPCRSQRLAQSPEEMWQRSEPSLLPSHVAKLMTSFCRVAT